MEAILCNNALTLVKDIICEKLPSIGAETNHFSGFWYGGAHVQLQFM
jgi:hypothetical protein